jgi:hypothetical protein
VFARVTTFTGPPEHIEEGLRLYRDGALPWLRDASGFRGFLGLVGGGGERSIGITFWATREAATDAAESGRELRRQVVGGLGLTMETLEILEVAVAEDIDLEE